MSNAKIAMLAGGAVALVLVAGGGGFKAGQFHQKVAYLEGRVAALDQVAVQPAVRDMPYGATPSVDPGAFAAPAQEPSFQVQNTLNTNGVPTQLAPVLEDPEAVAGLFSALSKATAFEADGEVSNEQPIYAFFDPRCPYCKRAMVELNGKAKVNWIPVSLLGDLQSGSDMIEGMRALDAQAAVAAVADDTIPEATGSAETQGQLQDNASILLALYEGASDMVAVPTFLVPRADGTAMFYRGFNQGDGAMLAEAYGS